MPPAAITTCTWLLCTDIASNLSPILSPSALLSLTAPLRLIWFGVIAKERSDCGNLLSLLFAYLQFYSLRPKACPPDFQLKNY